jgi:MEMO1 family protein
MRTDDQNSSLSRKLLTGSLLLCCASLISAPSCQEKPAESRPAAQEKKAVTESKPAKTVAPAPVFLAQVAGGFYPADAADLKSMLSRQLEAAAPAAAKVKGDLLGIFVPHAGYRYSGPVAARAFASLKGRKYAQVVVLGPAHRRNFAQPALLDASAYRTPLGDIPIDRPAVKRLADSGAAIVDESKFKDEHALEVELPFLQASLADFKLIPIMISSPDPAAAKKLARALKENFPSKNTLFVASTDMSHDFPYDVAVAMDKNAIDLIKALDSKGLLGAYQEYRRARMQVKLNKDGRPEPDCAQLCGMGPVLTLMELARLHADAAVEILDVRNSGDIVGDKSSRIVGYFSAAVSLNKARPDEKKEASGSTGDFLNEEEKQALLKIARTTLEVYLDSKEVKDFEPSLAKLKEPGAAFVTLKKHGRLKGCIGYMEPVDPLWKMIRDRAIDAAVRDSRFKSVTKEELKDITIEISVLSPRVLVKDPLKEIVIGRDGAWLEIGRSRGVFLPQVPVEQHWETVEIYLDHLCRKAHVNQPGCWKSAEARIQRFTALVFSEAEHE